MTNVSAAESATAKLLGEDEARRIATNLCQAAGAVAQALIAGVCQGWRHAGTHIQAVENQWKSSGKHVGEAKNKHGVVFIWSRRAEERGVCRLVDTALSFKSFRTVLGRALF